MLAAENLPEQQCLLQLEEQGRPYPAGSSAGGVSRPHLLSSFHEISDYAGWSGLLEEEKEGNVLTSSPISGEHTGGMAGEGPHLVNTSRHVLRHNKVGLEKRVWRDHSGLIHRGAKWFVMSTEQRELHFPGRILLEAPVLYVPRERSSGANFHLSRLHPMACLALCYPGEVIECRRDF